MKLLKKILSFIITILLLHSIKNTAYASLNGSIQNPVKVAVFLFSFDDLYLSHTKKNLENIQKENENKVNFTFFDAKKNQATQNESIDKALSEDFDLLVISLVTSNVDEVTNVFNKIISKNIPIILYSDSPTPLTKFISTYNAAVIIGGDNQQAGTLQGKVLIDEWNNNKGAIDKNNDNILQYIMIHGPINNPPAIARTKYSIQALNDAGIKTQQLSLNFCNWNQECAREAIESLYLNYDNKIEAIIANNDAMAIGAIEALQKYGFNKGDKSKYIPVVGVDGLPEAMELIKEGIMTGTVSQNTSLGAEAIYTIGMNLVSGNTPLSGTNYKFDGTGNTIRLPYYEHKK